MKQPMDKKKESKGPVSDKKPMDLLLLGLGIPVPGVGPTLEIKRNNKTIADWVNGHAKMKTSGPYSGERGIRFRRRTAEWITHTFRAHNKETDLCAAKGAKGRVGYRSLWVLGWKL